MYDSSDLYEKREAVLDELDRIIDKSEDRRAINEKKARAEISLLEDAIKKQKEKNEILARPVSGRVSSPLYISDTEYDTPSENSEENSPDEKELELSSKSTSLLISILINLNYSQARNRRMHSKSRPKVEKIKKQLFQLNIQLSLRYIYHFTCLFFLQNLRK